jgi:hypothetical protein
LVTEYKLVHTTQYGMVLVYNSKKMCFALELDDDKSLNSALYEYPRH